MLLSLKWLREFVPYTGTAEELGRVLTMLGLELDELCYPYKGLDNILVGLVQECIKHPEADKLSVCRVDIGTEVLDIVCGAPNVAAGQYVAVAPVGSVLPGGLVIKEAKLRGQVSRGMICSERELGLSDEHGEIMVLQELVKGTFNPGQKLLDVLDLDTEIMDIGVTPNRGDCLSVLGLAREVAMAFDLPLNMPSIEYSGIEKGFNLAGQLQLEIADVELAPVYFLHAVEGVTVKRSPAWLRWRLNAVGVRSISNVVDITNYILMELGQPLHSFDLDKIQGGKIIVANANDGEEFITLDSSKHLLSSRDITIRDTKGAVALGGVMGGKNSEITTESTNVLLEGAVFAPSDIRHTSKRLDIPSDAAYRFERGVDQGMTAYALERAAVMLVQVCGGKLAQQSLGSIYKPRTMPNIILHRQKAEDLIGVNFGSEFCQKTLLALGCSLDGAGTFSEDEVLNIIPPSYRQDLVRDVDIIEELARVYGVDRVPEELPLIPRLLERAGAPEPRHKFVMRVKRHLSDIGLNEVINYSFVGHSELDLLGIPDEGRVSIMNPLSAELDVLRTDLAPGLLNSLRNNLAQGAAGLRIFEVASSFHTDTNSETGVNEAPRLGILMYGELYGSGWPQQNEDTDYLDLKGVVEHLLSWLTISDGVEFLNSAAAAPWLLPAVDIVTSGKLLGQIGRVKPDLADTYYARKDVWIAEIDLNLLYDLHQKSQIRFVPLPVYPPVRRDITVIAPMSLQCNEIKRAIHDLKPDLLESVNLLDLFLPQGKEERNFTFRLTFRSVERTLQDAEIDKIRDKLAVDIVKKLPVRV